MPCPLYLEFSPFSCSFLPCELILTLQILTQMSPPRGKLSDQPVQTWTDHSEQSSCPVCNYALMYVPLTFASPMKSVKLEGICLPRHNFSAPTIHLAPSRNTVIICGMNVYFKCIHHFIFQLRINFLTTLLNKYDSVYNLQSAGERAWTLEYAFTKPHEPEKIKLANFLLFLCWVR